jgi:hypothetical protein
MGDEGSAQLVRTRCELWPENRYYHHDRDEEFFQDQLALDPARHMGEEGFRRC